MRLPQESAKRRMILETFGCYALPNVMLKISKAPAAEQEASEARIIEVLDDATIE